MNAMTMTQVRPRGERAVPCCTFPPQVHFTTHAGCGFWWQRCWACEEIVVGMFEGKDSAVRAMDQHIAKRHSVSGTKSNP